jgi:hypothetical protein
MNERKDIDIQKWEKGRRVVLIINGQIYSNVNIPLKENLEEFLALHGYQRVY